jgi:hypothetical protein
MPYLKETRKINKLNRIIAISYLIIFFLIVWIKRKYDDENLYFDRSNDYYLENIEKEDQINKLHKEIDSLKNINSKKEDVILDKPKENSEKKNSEKKKESSVIKIDSVPIKIEIDTLKK